jgi:hypothetical protein
MQQRPLVELSGRITISNNQDKFFFIDAYQELTNFLVCDERNGRTRITVRAAIDVRTFRGELDIPPLNSHIIVRGHFDDYTLDSTTKYITLMMIVVDHFEIQCGPRASRLAQRHRCNVSLPAATDSPRLGGQSLPTTPSSSSSYIDDAIIESPDFNEPPV